MCIIKRDDAGQHQQRADDRVNDELDSGVDAALAAPDADEQVHRHEHDFPVEIEEEQVHRHEDADQAGFERQNRD